MFQSGKYLTTPTQSIVLRIALFMIAIFALGGWTTGSSTRSSHALSAEAAINNTNPAAKITIIKDFKANDIDASTYQKTSFKIENIGDQEIESVTIDLDTAFLVDIAFDPTGKAGDSAFKCLEADTGAVDTGYVTPANICSTGATFYPFSSPNNGVDDEEGFNAATVDFNDFDPNEAFSFSVDVDPTSVKNDLNHLESASVSGLEMAGATVTVEFGDGSTLSNTIFENGTLAQGMTVVAQNAPAAPTISMSGVASSPATLTSASQTIQITGPANADVTLLHVDAHLWYEVGYDIDLYEANSILAVDTETITLDGSGMGSIPVTLLETVHTDENGGLNHFLAVVNGSNDQNSATSNLLLIEYSPGGTATPTSTPVTPTRRTGRDANLNPDYTDRDANLNPDYTDRDANLNPRTRDTDCDPGHTDRDTDRHGRLQLLNR